MNRILSLIGVVLVVGCGPEPRGIDTLQELNGVYMNPVDGQPYSGPVFEMFGNGRRMTGSLKDGEWDEPRDLETLQEVDGVWMNPEDGQPYSGPVFEMMGEGTTLTGSLKDGDFDGPFSWYYENGQMTKTTYKDGVEVGPVEEYYPNGQLWEKLTYKVGGAQTNRDRHGPYEIYHDTGQLREKGTYKDGERCGEWFVEGETVTYVPC